MKRLLGLLLLAVLLWPVDSYAQAPTVQASNVTVNYRYQNALSVSWTRGNGSKCLVVCKPASSSTSTPVTGSSEYSTSSTYGNGANLGNNNYAVYKGTGTSLYISGLNASTNYTIIVYEYNPFTIFSTNYYYLTSVSSSNLESAYTLCTQPTSNASSGNATSIGYTSATLSWTPGSGSYTLVTLDNYSTGSSYYNPTDGILYIPSTTYGSGALLYGDNYSVYYATGNSVNVTNLLPATTYRLSAFSYCGSSTGSTWNYNVNGAALHTFTTLNNPPTLNSVSNVTICENSSSNAVSLSGISDGSSLENQNVTVSVTSSNTTLFPSGSMSISYANPSTSGILYLTPATNQYGTATITVTVNDGFTSTNTYSRSFTVTVNPFPSAAGAISGTSTVCKNGSNYVYTVPAITNATGYVWTFPSGTVVVSGGSTNSVTVNFPASMSQTSGTIKVYGTNSNGCGTGVNSSFTVNFDATPTVSSAGADQIICTGTTQLQGNLPTVGSGIWTVNSGSAAFNSAVQYNTNVTGIASGQTVLLDWTISNGVCPSSVDQVSITYNPSAPQCLILADFFASNTSPCINNPINFTDNSVGATGWSWNFGANATPSTSNMQNPTGIVFTSGGPQTITLTVTGPNGSDGETKNSYINVLSTPGSASAISGNITVCEGDNQILYSINSISGATDYLWTLPSGAVINSGINTESISIDYNPGSVSGSLTVQGSNVCGTGNMSSLNITVNPLPIDAGTISSSTGLSTFCQGETGITFSVPSITNATSYDWSVPGGVNIVQNNGSSILVDFTSSAVSGNIVVYGINSCGNGISSNMTVTVNPLPDAAGSISGINLITNCPISSGEPYGIDPVANATSYTWTLPSGASITGPATNETITVDFAFGASSGDIIVTPENSCGSGTPNTLSIVVNDPVTENLCVVTVDDNSSFNKLVWEKDLTPVLSHYNIYREVTTNNYSLIATVDVDSLSEYDDIAADPNVTSYKYKITAVDTCGNESPQSNFHSTIHLQFLGNGNLQWTLYDIENQSNPVDFYEVFRDDSSTGNWNSISNTIPGGNSTFTDVNYANFSNPSYRVDVIWTNTCTSTRAGVNTSRSNIKNAPAATVGVDEFVVLDNVNLFPNPSHSSIQLTGIFDNTQIAIYNNLGQLVSSEKINNNSPIDISSLPNGIYTVKVNWNNYIKVLKFIKN